MRQFIRTKTGNLIAVSRIGEISAEISFNKPSKCWDRYGKFLTELEFGQVEALDRGPIIPDTTGAVLVEFFDDGNDGVSFTKMPIIGWQTYVSGDDEFDYPKPVICDVLPDLYCVEYDKFSLWVFPYDMTTDRFEAAVKHAKEHIDREIAREARAKAKREELKP